MQKKDAYTFTDTEMAAVAGLKEIAAQARVASFSTGMGLEVARATQLLRDRDRALRRGDEKRAGELDRKIGASAIRAKNMSGQRQREAIVPSAVPRGQSVVRGRVTEAGQGRRGLRVGLLAPDGKELESATTDLRGAFEIAHKPTETLALRVTGRGGVHLLDRKGLKGAPANSSTYVELAIDGIEPQAPPPSAPPADSQASHVSVPSLKGLSEDAGRKALRSLGLRSKRGEEVPSETMDGRILSQEPKAGATVPVETVVTFDLGIKSQERFPDLRGETLSTATKKISEMELHIQTISLESNPGQAGRVLDQAPGPDAPFKPTTRVLLRVATGEDGADLTTAAGLFERDPRAQKLGISGATFRRRLSDADVDDINALRKLAKRPLKTLGDTLKFEDRQVARAVQQIMGEIVARFPES